MKIGWVSVSPWAKTGYGRLTRDIVQRLLEKHDVMCLGHESDVIVWGGKKELTFPNGKTVTTLVMTNPLVNQQNTADMVRVYGEKYGFDVLIALWDVFALGFMKYIGTPFLDYIPIDAQMTPKWVDYTEGAMRVIPFSKFGYNEAAKFISPSRLGYVPHGVDTKAFRPLRRNKEDLREVVSAKANIPVPKDTFLFVNTAANYGARKHIPLLLKTFAGFVRQHPSSHLYLHTNVHIDAPNGYDLVPLIRDLGLAEHVSYPVYDPILEPVEDEDFAQLYNAADVYVTNSVGEGFGMPVIESMSCGIPVIAPNNSTMPELIKGRGWLVDNISEDRFVDYPSYVPTLQYFPVPDQVRFHDCMRESMEDEKMRTEFGVRARELAVKYDWDQVMPMWFNLLDNIDEELQIRKEMVAALRPKR